MTEGSMNNRLSDVLNSILCPVAGCWPLHGVHSEYFYDTDAESHVLEVWPIGVEEPKVHGGNGHHQSEPDLLYEQAEFDFTDLAKEISIEHFHFSQMRSIFEIGWQEDNVQMELRVHIVPAEADED